MKLYKFRALGSDTDKARLIDIIETKNFYCSRFDELNDPMEGVFMTNNLNIINSSYGLKDEYKICSFSGKKGFESPLMRGHYANAFRGVCLEIDIEDLRPIHRMIYSNKVISISNINEIEKILSRKLLAWKYENEFRFIVKGEDKKYKVGKLTKIYFGNPYGDVNNYGEIVNGNKSFKEFNKFKSEIKKICKKNGIKDVDVKIEDGKVVEYVL